MGLNFVLGTASKDHQAVLLDKLKTSYTDRAHANDKYFYLVPDHIKFGSEVAVLKDLQASFGRGALHYALHQVQVFSLSRLAWYFLKDDPAYQRPTLSQAGLNMLIKRILNDKQDELTLFNGQKMQSGFVRKLAEQLVELRNGNISAADVATLAEQIAVNTPQGQLLQQKLRELQIIYQEFEIKTAGKYLDSADVLALLVEKLKTMDLHNYHFYFAQMETFTAKEKEVLKVLLDQEAEVTVSLVLDKPYANSLPESNNLFNVTGKTFYQLFQLGQASGVSVEWAVVDGVNQTLRNLEDYWIKSTNGATGNQLALVNQNVPGLHVIKANNRFEELQIVASKIHDLVVNHGYEYRDFMVITPEIDLYRNIIDPVFKQQYHFSYFFDLTKKMADHPLVELIAALLTIPKYNYRYYDLMRLLKTELLIPFYNKEDKTRMAPRAFRRQLDLTENAILKYGKEGAHNWLGEEDWQFFDLQTHEEKTADQMKDHEHYITTTINQIRRFIKEILPPFYQALAEAENGREAAVILMQFLAANGVEEQLLKWRDAAMNQHENQAGNVGQKDTDLIVALQIEEVWQTFCGMMDEYVENLGDAPFHQDEFLDLLLSGFEDATYSQVPSALDQILVTEMRTTQLNDRKITFLIGATDNVLPGKFQSESLLSDTDRLSLNNTIEQLTLKENDESQVDEPVLVGEKSLNEISAQRMSNESFVAYQTFLSSSEQLFISYPTTDNSDHLLEISPFVQRLVKFFDLPVKNGRDLNSFADYYGPKEVLRGHLVTLLRDLYLQEGELPSIWYQVYESLKDDPATAAILASLSYHNEAAQLTPKNVIGLYSETLTTAVSKLETYYRNPYEYFLKYGLKLKERPVFELNAADKGTLYHEAFDRLYKELKEGQDLRDLTDEEYQSKMQTIINELLHEPRFAILGSSNRMQFLGKQIGSVIYHMGNTMRKQRAKSASIRTIGTEMMFEAPSEGQEEQNSNHLVGLNVAGGDVKVLGYIDRIDAYHVTSSDENDAPAEHDYLSVIDYKSSDKKFDYQQAYYGTTLQMLTYLNVLAQEENIKKFQQLGVENPAVAGAFYMQIIEPILKANEVKAETIAKKQLQENKMKGIIVDNRDLLEVLDESVKEGNISLIYPFGLLKKATPEHYLNAKASQNVLSPADLGRLLNHNKRLLETGGKAILAGKTDIEPIRFKEEETGLKYSPYLSIMRFDELLGNNYREVDPTLTKKADILKALAEQEIQDEEGEQ